ncbi:N-acetylglucosamine 6-phosphate deacetylase [Arthrobacter sp. FB24]|uniref:N-acetylglucosamine-6-phosphate deacetylase n=1 Tax=Arthrobacter sp. (strain FB24) TaxID=290399 RepID=UPI0000526760|nr:N-acetylglucosamine-6-phosphate deacetylase [Arthrobacter sp. FB24]ABK01582.1 N-acetylglucosamine 6-phosphate deacetylase [Arthrobacter sp. FB24]
MTPADLFPSTSRHPAEGRTFVLAGTVLSDGRALPDHVVAVVGDRIAFAGPQDCFDAADYPRAVELELPAGGFILPGLVDLHCHGAAGGDFPGGNGDACRTAVDFLHRHGTTTLLASLVTASRDDLLTGIRSLRVLAGEGLIAGIHSEGPFLSAARCGAQNPGWLRHPDLALAAEMLAAAGGTLKSMTYAPELPGARDLVSLLAQHGVTPSLGHTDADPGTAASSLEHTAESLAAAPGSWAGTRPTVTHLFNGMPPLHHRNPGPVSACLRLARAGTAAVELIADGVHLSPETVRMVFELVGAENVVLVTDSMAATGLPDGDYALGPAAVSVRDAVATLQSNGALAGGTATMLDVVRRTVAAGVSAADAAASASCVPARILGMDNEVGSVRPGMRADLLAVDAQFSLLTVLRAGTLLGSAAS